MTASKLCVLTEVALAFAGAKILGSVFGSPNNIKPLVDLGMLVPVGQLLEVKCEECDESHMAPVIFGDAGPRAVCFRTSIEFVPDSALTTYEVRAAPLADKLAENLGGRTRWAQPRTAPYLWSLGTYMHLDLRVAVYFMLNAGDLERLNDAMGWLKRDPRPDAIAVLTNEARDLSDIVLPWDGRIVRLIDYICSNGRAMWTLDRTRLAERVIPARLLAPKGRGRPRSAYVLAAALIPEIDRNGALRAINSIRGRHRVVLAEAKSRHGPRTTLSIGSCEKAFQDYLRKAQFSRN